MSGLVALGLLLGAGSCVGHRTAEPSDYRSPFAKLRRVLALDFSQASRQRSLDSFEKALASPWTEMQRTHRAIATVEDAWDAQASRIEHWPERIPGLFAAESSRLTHLRQRFPEIPLADDFANKVARNIANTTRFLGLERRPLGEPSDPEHRTDPTDDRPVMTWWQRIRRRFLQ